MVLVQSWETVCCHNSCWAECDLLLQYLCIVPTACPLYTLSVEVWTSFVCWISSWRRISSFSLRFQNILIMLVGRQDTNISLFLNVFLRILRKTYWVKRISKKNFGHHFFMPTLAFSCRPTSAKVISEPPLSSLTQTIWLYVDKNCYFFLWHVLYWMIVS